MINIRKQTKRKSTATSTRSLNVTVVDAHHHVLRPIWAAIRAGKMPRRGVKFLHFDSHPDMGVFGSDDENDRAKWEIKEMRDLLPQFYNGQFDEIKALKYHEIATWVPTLVFQGVVDEVIWGAGWWCTQIPVGTYDLVVGRSTVTGTLKIATPDNRRSAAWSYWESDNAFCKIEELEMQRPWKLHVVKFNKSCQFPEEGKNKIVKICKGKPWVLDIDLDYLSCQNPLMSEFHDFFGKAAWEKVEYIWGVCNHQDYHSALENIITEKAYLGSKSKFLKHQAVQDAVQELLDCDLSEIWKGGNMTQNKAEKILLEFKEIICKSSMKESQKESYEHYAHGPDWLIDASGFIGIPHHISTQQQIIKLLHSTGDLFKAISTPPRVATVATSREDWYTPDLQAPIMNAMMLDLLENQWSVDTKTYRHDFTNGLSIDNHGGSGLALYLSKGKSDSMPKKLKPPSK